MARHAADSNFKALRGKRTDMDGNRMGLTEAFAPIDADYLTSSQNKGTEDVSGNPMGLTEAFAPVSASAAGSQAYDAAEARAARGKHARPAVDAAAGEGASSRSQGANPQVNYYQQKSRRMRKILIGIVVLLILLIVALGYFSVRLLSESKTLASQQTQEQQNAQEVGAMQDGETSDSSAYTTKKTDVVELTDILGLTQDEAIELIGRGAEVTSSRDVDQEGSDIKKEVTLALTDEPADSRSGTPSVFLSLDESGAIVRAGYSAATSSLGYGALSFSDAIEEEHVIENALRDAGLSVDDGAAELPEDKADYSSYDSDGTTLLKESCSFQGTGTVDDKEHAWNAVLLYDYVAANASGNLKDTVRVLYIYIEA